MRASFLACLRNRLSRTAASRFILAIVVFFFELDAMRHPFVGSGSGGDRGSRDRPRVEQPADLGPGEAEHVGEDLLGVLAQERRAAGGQARRAEKSSGEAGTR